MSNAIGYIVRVWECCNNERIYIPVPACFNADTVTIFKPCELTTITISSICGCSVHAEDILTRDALGVLKIYKDDSCKKCPKYYINNIFPRHGMYKGEVRIGAPDIIVYIFDVRLGF